MYQAGGIRPKAKIVTPLPIYKLWSRYKWRYRQREKHEIEKLYHG
jgi:hypothetical protein